MDDGARTSLSTMLDPARLRLLGLLASAPMAAAELARATGLSRPVVERHLDRLASATLVRRAADPGGAGPRFELAVDRLHALAAALADLAPADEDPAATAMGPDGSPIPADEARVLRSFFADGRLTTIPAAAAKRAVVLRYLRDRVFTEPRPYPEKEVNQRLALFHPDVASLRRYMVDDGLVTREAGEYRRAGET